MKVPTISLASYFHASNPETDVGVSELATALRLACEEVGFFVITDHGIDSSLLERQRRECQAFFKRPPQSLVVNMLGSSLNRFTWLDYVPPSSTGAAQEGAWCLGPVEGRGSMPWQPEGEAFSSTWAAYYEAMEGLVAILMRLFAIALELPADSFRDALTGHRSSMRAILYPEVSEAELADANGEVVRSPEHTDWGCVTVLLPDPEVTGLEVCGKDGVWTPLQPCPGSLVVNLGELLQWWTGGKWLATLHRVVARPGSASERLSLPYFGLVNRSTVLASLITADSPAGEEAENSITAGEFFDKHEEFSKRFKV